MILSLEVAGAGFSPKPTGHPAHRTPMMVTNHTFLFLSLSQTLFFFSLLVLLVLSLSSRSLCSLSRCCVERTGGGVSEVPRRKNKKERERKQGWVGEREEGRKQIKRKEKDSRINSLLEFVVKI
jgi:hypothetical protein